MCSCIAEAFNTAMLLENGITPSMSAPGCPYDNACMESFFTSFKKELFYNRKRLHCSLMYVAVHAPAIEKATNLPYIFLTIS